MSYPSDFAEPTEEIMCPVQYEEGRQAVLAGEPCKSPYDDPGDIWQQDRSYWWRRGWWDALNEVDEPTFQRIQDATTD